MRAIRYFTWAILVGFSLEVLAIKCFQCNSAEYPACDNLTSENNDSPFLKKCLEDYEGQPPFCRKTKTYVNYADETRVYRSSGWIKSTNESNKDKCKKRDTDFVRKITCSCFSDGCNSSHIIGESQYLILFSLLICLTSIYMNYVE